MPEPIPPITLPPCEFLDEESRWLRENLQIWLDQEYLPEPVNQVIAERAASIYLRQRLEGEQDMGSLLMAIVTEMQNFDFTKSFYSEFAVANAVSDLLLKKLGIDGCCGSG
ncbi:hypothetical protein GS597_18735 [Synechococcales cyanobacterium C]|uniref:Uncharacterized protein n=1 Tax=Petrachloros mirabilis ULC683 TaxID=2781853 RepID=A0A8K2A273_9CYAN|nr:iron-containing alcohol dehydrogenase family protein [Petrachloros mirabilis]NCJ08506.1 hypothetical protein [Petrachloros mirabilis ULC683]